MLSFQLPPPQTPFEVALPRVLQLISSPVAGPTMSRPQLGLTPGLQYFDISLGKPVWWSGSQWVDATGANA